MKVRVDKRGVVVIPKSVRERSGIKEGAFLELDVAGDAPVLRVKDSGASYGGKVTVLSLMSMLSSTSSTV